MATVNLPAMAPSTGHRTLTGLLEWCWRCMYRRVPEGDPVGLCRECKTELAG